MMRWQALIVGSCVAISAAESSGQVEVTRPSAHPADGWVDIGPSFWIESQLDLIRRDVPWPTVQARTLFHVSAAMHDTWAAFEPRRRGALIDRTAPASIEDSPRTRRIAIGHAAREVMMRRYARTNRDGLAALKLEANLRKAGLLGPLAGHEAEAAAFGADIGRAVLDAASDDGSNEAAEYDDTSGYRPANSPFDPEAGAPTLRKPDRWQPVVVDGRTQEFVTPHWGRVRPFAIEKTEADRPYFDPGPPPLLNPEQHPILAASLVELVLLGSQLDGLSLDPRIRAQADRGRVLAEYWEDGPNSESPPGHWNRIAIECVGRLEASGTPLTLEDELVLFLALNACLHDAAIACWDVKRFYDSVRPISLIRYMAALGQSSDPSLPHFHSLALPIVPGLIEIITQDSSKPGGAHEALAEHIGEVAVRGWLGSPEQPTVTAAGVGWILGVNWTPYQNEDFVTPAFAGYVSGHSTFSAAAAAALQETLGTDDIPGGGIVLRAAAGGFLEFERGPSNDVELMTSTFTQAVDQAGRSRLWGGIHPWFDDVEGRQIGAAVARDVLRRLEQLDADTPVSCER